MEGELNALSIWQALHGTGRQPARDGIGREAAGPRFPEPPAVDVISSGAQGNAAHPAAIKLARRYGSTLIWTDESGPARMARSVIDGAYALCSPDGLDANDLLQRGQLEDFLSAGLEDICAA